MLPHTLALLQSLFSNPQIFVPTVWVCLGCTLAWYLLSAKSHQEISTHDVEMLWKSHKQFSNCNADDYEPIVKGTKIVGYQCECGHKHQQKRPLINFGA